MVELLSPIALPDAQAAVSSSVELLSSIAPPDALAAASYGFTAAFLTGHAGLMLRSIGDNRSTIETKQTRSCMDPADRLS
jgi:hypothetical protein